MKIAAEKKRLSLSQAKHLLSILMGINGRAGTGDRGVDWLVGPALTQPPLSILPALLFTANTSCCALPAHSAPADVYICALCVYCGIYASECVCVCVCVCAHRRLGDVHDASVCIVCV